MHTQHLRNKLDKIERDSGLDGEELKQLTLSDILNHDIDRLNENIVVLTETGERRKWAEKSGPAITEAESRN